MFSVIEQFKIYPICQFTVFGWDWTISNFFGSGIFALLFMLFLISIKFFFLKNSETKAITKKITTCFTLKIKHTIKSLVEISVRLVSQNVFLNAKLFVPSLVIFFNTIFFCNLLGLLPYSFTVTSHLLLTFTLAFAAFISINIRASNRYGTLMFSLFIPANTSIYLALLLIPLEFISYIAKPLSLGVRLFINIVAGHCLLKVVVGFYWGIIAVETPVSFGIILTLSILVVLFLLELGVAAVQTYVFIVLICIYAKDTC
jgi:ATP synthase subunit 6